MFKGTLANYKIRLTNEQYGILLNRFDVSKIKSFRDGRETIRKPCICFTIKETRVSCHHCPFVRNLSGRCGPLIRYYDNNHTIAFSGQILIWNHQDHNKAVEIITKIWSDLIKFEKVK